MPFRSAPLLALFSLAFVLILAGDPGGQASAQQPQNNPPAQSQQLVEEVDVTGHRRQRKEDILYFVQTKPGDPYDAQAVLAAPCKCPGALQAPSTFFAWKHLALRPILQASCTSFSGSCHDGRYSVSKILALNSETHL